MADPVKIQLAIQGGGAKIVALMAVLEALEDLSKDIQVTRVVGSSAGAIAGVFFASDVGIKNIVNGWKNGELDKLMRELEFPKPLILPARLSVMRHLFKPEPIWKTQAIHSYIQSVLNRHPDKPTKFSALNKIKKIKVSAISTDICDRRSRESDDEDLIVNALLNSAGLPYLMRKWNTGGSPVIVDGGIGDNLPATKLLERLNETQTDETAVCISFAPVSNPVANPTSFSEFSLSLLDAAIDVSSSQSAALVPNTFFIKTTIRTFDFPGALTALKSDEYGQIKNDATVWFKSLSQNIRTLREQEAIALSVTALHPWQTENTVAQAVMRGLWTAIERQFSEQRFQFHRVELRITVGTLAVPKGHDTLKYTIEFEPGEDPLYCYWISAEDGVEGQLTEEPTLTVRSLDTHDFVPTVRVPVISKHGPAGRATVIFFTPPLTKGKRYCLTQTEVGLGLMRCLATDSMDNLGVEPNRVDNAIKLVDLVVDMPKAVSKYKIHPQANLHATEILEFGPENLHLTAITAITAIVSPPGYKTHVVRGIDAIGLFALDISLGK